MSQGDQQRTDEQKRLFTLILIMASICLGVVGVTMFTLYNAAFEKERAWLQETGGSLAHLIEAAAPPDAVHTREDHPEGAASAALTQIINAHSYTPKGFPFDPKPALPMRRALSEMRGTAAGPGCCGHESLPAHEPVPKVNYGIVAGIDLAGIQAPFVKTGAIALSLAIVFIIAGTILFLRVSNRMLKRLQESEEKYRLLISNIPDVVCVTDHGCNTAFISPNMEQLSGYLPEEIYKEGSFFWSDRIHPEDVEQFKELYDSLFKGNQEFHVEYRMKRKGGSWIWLQDKSVATYERDGKMYTNRLLSDITEIKQIENVLKERANLVSMEAEMGAILNSAAGLQDILQRCSQVLVDHLSAAFARVWTLREDENVLALQASAGMYTHLDGVHGRIQVGSLKIGRIAEERKPHLTNTVIGDPHISDQEWAKQERMVAFAGYPLIGGDRLIGVAAMFSRHALSDATLEALASIADGIALGIKRKQAEEGLRVSKEIAEVASRAKSDFLSGMSHELRTPLNAIIGFSEVLRDQYFGALNDKQAEYIRDILESGKDLLSLINDILALSTVETGKLKLELSEVKIGILVEQSLMMIREKAHKHGIDLDLDVASETKDLVIRTDERKFKQVMFNLLSNAVKFTPEGGRISVSARTIDCRLAAEQIEKGEKAVHGSLLFTGLSSCVEISVEDTGIGIESGQQERIFEEFYQVKGGIASKTPGSGVGLPLTKELIEMHGGEIWVESRGEGKGSKFSFLLPTQPAHLDEEGVELR